MIAPVPAPIVIAAVRIPAVSPVPAVSLPESSARPAHGWMTAAVSASSDAVAPVAVGDGGNG